MERELGDARSKCHREVSGGALLERSRDARMLAVREATPATVSVALKLRRLLYEGTFDELTPVFELAREATEMNLGDAAEASATKRLSLCAEAKEQSRGADALAELVSS